MALDKDGAKGYCVSGHKMLCCKVADENLNSCYWTQQQNLQCNSGDTEMTWEGPYKDFPTKRFCCPQDDAKKWKNCNWKGSGSCDSNHCDLLTEVQLATSSWGESRSCLFDRKQAFCCQPSDARPLFLPVPLDHLFPNPPTGDGVTTDFTLELDDTWGTGSGLFPEFFPSHI